MSFKFRDFQGNAVSKSLDYINGPSTKPGVLVEPTAAGKSWVIAGIATEYPGPILVLQPSIELLKQNYEKFILMGGEASIYSAGAGSKEIGHVTYATLGSIKNEWHRFKEAGVNLVIIDECHLGVKPDAGSMFRKFMDKLNPRKVIGLTATPFRLHNNMMGSQLKMLNRTRPRYFTHFIDVVQISQMIEGGYWSPSVDESWIMDESVLRLNSTGSDYTEDSIRKYVEVNGINNKIYLRILDAIEQGRKSILVFVDSVASCEKFCQFLEQEDNISCNYLTSDTKKKERKVIVEGFKSGEINVIFNYGILSTGFDYPELSCIIMGRPTNSLAVFYQIYGRGVRICEGKEDFLFVDYGNNFERLAHPREIVIEDFPNHGWAVFCGERLVTGVYLSDGFTITKEDIRKKAELEKSNDKFSFGKYKGKLFTDVAKSNPGYITWLLEQDWLKDHLRKTLTDTLKVVQLSGAAESAESVSEMNVVKPEGPKMPF